MFHRSIMIKVAARAGAGVNFVQARKVTTAKLPDLSYDFGALEPVISGEIMQIHHQKVHNYHSIHPFCISSLKFSLDLFFSLGRLASCNVCCQLEPCYGKIGRSYC